MSQLQISPESITDNEINPAPDVRLPDPKEGHFVSVESVFSGPLPPPDVLQKYDSILPGAAEAIFNMAKSQLESDIAINRSDSDRRDKILEIQAEAISKRLRYQHEWQIFIMCVILLLFALCAFAFAFEKYVGSVIAFVTALGVFIYKAYWGGPDNDKFNAYEGADDDNA